MQSQVEEDTHTLALRIIADRVSPCIGPFIEQAARPFELLPESQPSGLSSSEICTPCTWVCKNRLFFTLVMQFTGQPSYVVDNSRNIVYAASSSAQLARECPEKTAFLCQFTMDRTPAGAVEPRLLVFDILCPGVPATQRYERLRAMEIFLPKPLCCVQWAGDRRCMTREFLASLPHEADGVMWLGPAEDPFRVSAVDLIPS